MQVCEIPVHLILYNARKVCVKFTLKQFTLKQQCEAEHSKGKTYLGLG